MQYTKHGFVVFFVCVCVCMVWREKLQKQKGGVSGFIGTLVVCVFFFRCGGE